MDGDAAAKEKQQQLPKLDSAWKEEVEDAGGAAVLATVEDDASGQRSTGAGKEEFLLGEAQVRVAVVLCCRVPWRGGDEEDGALGAGQEARAAGSGTTQTSGIGSWRCRGPVGRERGMPWWEEEGKAARRPRGSARWRSWEELAMGVAWDREEKGSRGSGSSRGLCSSL